VSRGGRRALSEKPSRAPRRRAPVTVPSVDGAANVVIADGSGDAAAMLSQALTDAGLWADLARAAAAAGTAPADLRILVKPELGGFAAGPSTATDPALVEALIDLLHDAGFTNVVVGGSRDSWSLWLENRDVLVLADLLGYRFATPKGRAYDIADLGEDLAPFAFPAGAVLHGSSLARAWSEAQYRIVFAKNRTDERDAYALCLDCLIGALPLEDKDYHYRYRFGAGEVALELLRATPVDFALIDAIVSSHGSGGARAPCSIETRTVIASRHLLLADYAGAAKMGLDPYASPVNAAALRALGLPARFRIDGNLACYPNWRNVHPLVCESTRQRDAWVAAARTVKPWLQSLDRDLFPIKHPVDDKLNGALAPVLAQVDDSPLAFWAMIGLNRYVAGVHRSIEAYATLFRKDALRHRDVPLGLDLERFTAADYEVIEDELRPMTALVRSLPTDANGLRWRYLDEAVVFEFTRVVPLPFEEFAARVDVTRTIQFMNDYIGGVAVPVARDEHGRVTHQAERNLYLPQPNYLVLSDGDVIDVTKLEHATYGVAEHRMAWKTIVSQNGSARFDDGIVSFAREDEDTRVSICGRQLFNLPPFWQAVNLDLLPELKTLLVTDAYTTFFRRTLANLEAVAEGREVRIGRAWHDPAIGTELLPLDRAIESFTRLKDKFGGKAPAELVALFRQGSATPQPIAIDADGFRHFKAPATAIAAPSADGALSDALRAFVGEIGAAWRDFAAALQKDAATALTQLAREGK
jgi:uncharacterized protein (DUF362 family)